jgi:hypothetical protein
MTNARSSRRLALLASVLLAAPAAIAAQGAPSDSGARIRIWGTGHDTLRVGTLVQLGGDTIVYRPGLGSLSESLSLTRVRFVDKSRGFHIQPITVLKDAAIGSGIGIVSGVTLGLVICKAQSVGGNSSDIECPVYGAAAGIALGLVGVAVGGIIGLSDNTESWERLYPLETGMAPLVMPNGQGRVSFGLALPFEVSDQFDLSDQ